MEIHYLLALIIYICSCNEQKVSEIQEVEETHLEVKRTYVTSLVILGTIQDAGQPHIACKKQCCVDLFENPDKDKQVISLGLYDKSTGKKYLFLHFSFILHNKKK